MRPPNDPARLARVLPFALPALLFRGGCCPSSDGPRTSVVPWETVVQRSDGAVLVPAPDAALTRAECLPLCDDANAPGLVQGCRLRRVDGGVQSVACDYNVACYAGRAPPGLAPRASDAADAVARFFADTQRLEAAAVDAFALLTRELSAHEAPASLVARSVAAQGDERRHGARMAALATAAGAALLPHETKSLTPRSFAAMAVDNAVEGCARETWAAMVALHQSRSAEDATVRRAFAAIACDELAHAALSWDIARWCAAHASEATRREARAGWRDALEDLRPDGDGDGRLARALGLPDAAASNALLDAIGRASPV